MYALFIGEVAQLEVATALQAVGHRFDPDLLHQFSMDDSSGISLGTEGTVRVQFPLIRRIDGSLDAG